MIEKQSKREEEYNNKMREEIELAQEEAFNRVLDNNAHMKEEIIANFRQKLNTGNLSTEEQAAMMADLNAKMATIGDALEEEQNAQNRALNDALKRRRAKQQKLKSLIEGISDKKDTEDDHYQKKLLEIQKFEDDQKTKVDEELKAEREAGIETIEEEGKKIRDAKLAAAERRLKDMKNKGLANSAEDEFADAMAAYGKQVEEVDEDMKEWRKGQLSDLDERLRQRRLKKLQELEDQKKDNEAQLNKDTQKQRSRLNDEIDQVQSLLKPVQDEEDRLKMIAGDLVESDAVNKAEGRVDLQDVEV